MSGYLVHFLLLCIILSRNKVILMPHLGAFFMEQYEFADVFNELELTDSEIGIITGIMIMNPGEVA